MWGLLTSKLGLAGIALALVLGVIGVQTLRLDHARHELSDLKASDKAAADAARAHAAQVNAETAALAKAAGYDAGKAQAQIITRTRTLVQHVHDAIPAASDVRLGPQWMLGYDISLGLSPVDAGPAPGTASGSGVRSADAFNVVAENNAAALIWKDHAERCIAFYDAVRAKINGPTH